MAEFGPENPGAELEEFAEQSPAMLWRGDMHGRCVYLNAALRAFWGLNPEDCGKFEWTSSLLEEDHQAVFGPFGIGMSEQKPFVCEGRYRRADGAIRWVRTRARPIFGPDGAFGGMVGVNEDITEQRNAEAELRRRNDELAERLDQLRLASERFQLATQITGFAMSEHDDQLRYTWAHNLPDTCLGRTPREIVGDEVGGQIEIILRRVLEFGQPQSEEISFLVNDRRSWCDIQAAPTTLPDGRNGVVASALDVTARKLNEQKLEVLALEFGHRIKNTFALVQGLLRQSAKSSGATAGFISALEARLGALAQSQSALMASSEEGCALLPLLQVHLSHLENVVMSGPEVAIPGRLAPYLGLVAHELGTNALKYGSLSTPGGEVRLDWSLLAPGLLDITWRETGGPPPAENAGRKGFGSALLTRIFADASGGEVDLRYAPDGLVWSARFGITPHFKISLPEAVASAAG